jgi:predicted molibdopterin-dependent oxidoreductase YjgC
MSNVMTSARLPRVGGSAAVAVTVDGESVQAYPGEMVATVLLAMGRLSFRHTDRGHSPRGVFCGMGVCFDCLVTIDGQPNVRACLTPVQAGMVVETGGPAHA